MPSAFDTFGYALAFLIFCYALFILVLAGKALFKK